MRRTSVAARLVGANVIFRERHIHRVTLPVTAGPHINTTSEAWERNEIFQRGKDPRACLGFPAESAAYVLTRPRRAPLAAAKIGDGLIFGVTLARLRASILIVASDSPIRSSEIHPKENEY